MKIAKISISNFRCFGPQPATIELDDLTTLVGANGAGKSAVLQAIVCLFGARSADRRLSRGDFHVPLDTAPDALEQIPLWIEARLEFPGLGTGEDDGVPECFKQMIVEEEGFSPFCRVRLDGL